MKLSKYIVAALASMILLGVSATSFAAFPNFTGCPRSAPNVRVCIDIQNVSGNLNIKGFNVPLGDSLEIRGALTGIEGGLIFYPAAGTTGLIARPVQVPGGLLGIDFPIPGNSVTATTELAGSPSDIKIDTTTLSIRVPIKVRLTNILLGMDCHIGSNSSPVVLNLITGTTNPPPPNRPITGHVGELAVNNGVLTVTGNDNVDNTFAVPASSTCGLGLGLINALVNAKMQLPSAAGNNSIAVHNNVGLLGLGE